MLATRGAAAKGPLAASRDQSEMRTPAQLAPPFTKMRVELGARYGNEGGAGPAAKRKHEHDQVEQSTHVSAPDGLPFSGFGPRAGGADIPSAWRADVRCNRGVGWLPSSNGSGVKIRVLDDPEQVAEGISNCRDFDSATHILDWLVHRAAHCDDSGQFCGCVHRAPVNLNTGSTGLAVWYQTEFEAARGEPDIERLVEVRFESKHLGVPSLPGLQVGRWVNRCSKTLNQVCPPAAHGLTLTRANRTRRLSHSGQLRRGWRPAAAFELDRRSWPARDLCDQCHQGGGAEHEAIDGHGEDQDKCEPEEGPSMGYHLRPASDYDRVRPAVTVPLKAWRLLH